MAKTNRVGSHKTVIGTDDGWTFVQYHATEVVQWNESTIILNSNGWETVTTKLRMNQASNQFDLGFYVYQKDFNWFVEYKGEILKYYDGMQLER